MLTVTDNLASLTLGAGEPFLLQVAFQEVDGKPSDLSARAFVLTFYRANRQAAAKIDGELSADGTFLRFEEDGSFSEQMFGQAVSVELSERLRAGRNRIATGTLNVQPTALGVASLDNAPVGYYAVRVVYRKAGSLGDRLVFSQSDVAYVPPAVAPALTLGGPLAYTVGTAAGTLVATIGNVPAGATPTVTPSDGRLAIAGDASNGWEVVTGLSASSAGTIAMAVSASGAIAVQAGIVVSSPAAPSVTSRPTIQSDGTPQVGETVAGVAGTYANGVVSARRWLLNGSAISGANGEAYGLTAIGQLVYQEDVTGAGGTITSSSDPVTVTAAVTTTPARFTVGQPAHADSKLFARKTKTGGREGIGEGTIPAWPINVTATGAIYARLVAKGDPNRQDGAVVQTPWLLSANVSSGTTSIDITRCGCGEAWFQVQLSGTSTGPWLSAPNPVRLGICRFIYIVGQSLPERQIIAGAPAGPGSGPTLADVGVDLNPYLSYIATSGSGDGTGPRTVDTPTWGPPVQVGVYDGAGFAHLGDQFQKRFGCNIGIASHTFGGQSAAGLTKQPDGTSGSSFGPITEIMDIVEAWEDVIWWQGHTDASQGMAERDYKAYLTWFFGYAASKNYWGNQVRGLVMSIPNEVTNVWGTPAQKNTIRRAAATWVKSEGQAMCALGCYYANTYTLDEYDNVHPSQQGSKQAANLQADALLDGINAFAGDDVLLAPAPLQVDPYGNPTFGSPGRFRATGMDGGAAIGAHTPLIGPRTYTTWIKKPNGAGSPFSNDFGFFAYYYSADQATPGQLAIHVDSRDYGQVPPYSTPDNNWHHLAIEEDAFPYDQTKPATISVRVDGVLLVIMPMPIPAKPTGGRFAIRTNISSLDAYLCSGVFSDAAVYNRLNVPVPIGPTPANDPFLYASIPLDGSVEAA